MRAAVQRLELPEDRRLVVVSDLHGDLAGFRGLLKKVGFSRRDILILDGDLVERGPENLELLRYVMELHRTHTVHTLRGNCDNLYCGFPEGRPETVEEVLRYCATLSRTLFQEMCRELGEEMPDAGSWPALRGRLCSGFSRELAFLRGLPDILETQNYTFVHGGLEPGPLEEQEGRLCRKNDSFYQKGYAFSKYLVVGHTPVGLYRDRIDLSPLLDRERKILSIDGGNQVNLHGQLNALLIDSAAGDSFRVVSHDLLPQATALEAQSGAPATLRLRWPDVAVEALRREGGCVYCRHRSTGRVFWVPEALLYERQDSLRCGDFTDEQLEVREGERLSLVCSTARGSYVKKDSVCGWYYGRLAPAQVSR